MSLQQIAEWWASPVVRSVTFALLLVIGASLWSRVMGENWSPHHSIESLASIIGLCIGIVTGEVSRKDLPVISVAIGYVIVAILALGVISSPFWLR